MTEARVTQEAIQVATSRDPEARVTQAASQVLVDNGLEARVTQASGSLLGVMHPEARLTQAFTTILHRPKKPRQRSKQIPQAVIMTSSRGIAGDPYYNYVAFLMTSKTGVRDVSKYRQLITGDKRIGPRVVLDADRTAFYQANTSHFGNLGSTDVSNEAPPNPDRFYLGRKKFTLEAWVKPTKNDVGILGCYDTGTNDRGWAFKTDSSGRLQFWASVNNTGADIELIGPILAANAYSHVAVDRDETRKFRLYVNGVMVASQENDGVIRKSSAPLSVLGYSRAPSANFAGYVDDIRLTIGISRYASDTGFTPKNVAVPVVEPIDQENDPYWDLVSLWMNAETTTPVDRSKRAAPITPVTGRTNSRVMLYGDTSRRSWYNNDTPMVVENVDGQFDLSGGPFTLEFVGGYNSTGGGGQQTILIPGQLSIYANHSNWNFNVWNGTAWTNVLSGGSSYGRYAKVDHVVVSVDAQFVARMYIQGKLVARGVCPPVPPVSSSDLTVFSDSALQIAEVRLTKGVARWTDDYGIPADEVVYEPPTKGPTYEPQPVPPPAYPHDLGIINPRAERDPGAEWINFAGGIPGRYNKFVQRGGLNEAPNEFWFFNFGTTTRVYTAQRLEVPPQFTEDVNEGLVDVVFRLAFATAPDTPAANGSIVIRALDGAGVVQAHRFSTNRSGSGWGSEAIRMALPPNTVAVDIGFMGFNSGTWPSIIAAKLKASLEKRILPVSYVTSPKHPVQVAEWASPSGALIAYGIDYGLTGIGCVTQVGEYYHAADLPTSRLPDVDAGLCAFTAQWFGVLRNGDVDDGGRVYIEFRDAEGAVVGVRCYDSPAMYKHAFGGAGCQMYVRIPSGARKVRFGIFGQRRVGKSATSYPSFYPIGFSGYVTKPDALPPLPPVPPTPDYDPHWARVRYLLSSRNGQVESLASPAPTTHAVNGTVRHTTENSKFGDGHNIEINPTGAAANTHFINVVLNGAALQTALTFEGWFYKKGNPRNYMGITNQFGQINDSASHLRANGPVVGADAPIPLDEWFHFALCRGETGKTSCFVNGKRQQLEREAYTGGWGTTFTLGRGSTASDNSSWYGYMDEVRLTEGVIRYTDDFVPQSNRFPTRDTTTPSSNSIKLSGDETGREKLSGDTSDGDDVLEISGD